MTFVILLNQLHRLIVEAQKFSKNQQLQFTILLAHGQLAPVNSPTDNNMLPMLYNLKINISYLVNTKINYIVSEKSLFFTKLKIFYQTNLKIKDLFKNCFVHFTCI